MIRGSSVLIKSMRHIVAGPPNTCGRDPPKKH